MCAQRLTDMAKATVVPLTLLLAGFTAHDTTGFGGSANHSSEVPAGAPAWRPTIGDERARQSGRQFEIRASILPAQSNERGITEEEDLRMRRQPVPLPERKPEGKGSDKGKGDTKPSAKAKAEDEAEAHIRKFDKNDPPRLTDKTRMLADLYAHLATATSEGGAAPIAAAIERLWLFHGSDTVELLMARAGKANEAGNTALAIKLLTAVVDIAPDYTEGWGKRAWIYFKDGAYEHAMGDLRRVLALDPNHFKALEGAAHIMRELDRKPAAHRFLERLLEVHPFAPGARNLAEELGQQVRGRGI